MAIKKTLPNPPSKIDDHESLVMAIHFRIMPTQVRTDGKKYKTLPVKLNSEGLDTIEEENEYVTYASLFYCTDDNYNC